MKIANTVSKIEFPAKELKEAKGINFKQILDNLESSWANVESRSDRLVRTLPLNVKPLVETQLVINELSLQTQMITRAGEAVASTLRRIQQFGS